MVTAIYINVKEKEQATLGLRYLLLPSFPPHPSISVRFLPLPDGAHMLQLKCTLSVTSNYLEVC